MACTVLAVRHKSSEDLLNWETDTDVGLTKKRAKISHFDNWDLDRWKSSKQIADFKASELVKVSGRDVSRDDSTDNVDIDDSTLAKWTLNNARCLLPSLHERNALVDDGFSSLAGEENLATEDKKVCEVVKGKRNGRPRPEHPTKVYGEVTRHWTPVFTLLEHKYIDKKRDQLTELGKPKRRGVIVPAGLTYGRANEKRDGGSSEALHGWPTLSPSTLPFKRKEKTAQRDFMALNRAAVSAGLVTADTQYQFRATHDVRRKPQSEEGQRMRTRRMPPSMVYGISTRPSTPIFDLLEHKYQDRWLQERRKLELAKRQEEHKQKRSPCQVYETRASLLRTFQNPVDSEPLWQMPKFKKEARPSLQTFRSAKARQQAYENFETDQISRKGNLGHGTYEAAKN